MTTRRAHRSLLARHSLSLTVGAGVLIWFALYLHADPTTHWGAFFGNSIADWLGSLVLVLATKFWYEKGSVESRLPPKWRGVAPEWVHEHSLSMALAVTWIGWIWWFAHIDANGRTGQVVGNIVSEWGQTFSLVIFTKYLYERGSKESKR
jgi:hypothetical protein